MTAMMMTGSMMADKAVAVRTKEALLLPRVVVLMRILGMLPQQKKIKVQIINL